MAAATTAIGSCFSAAITPCIRSKLVVSDTFLLKVASSRAARVLATAHHAWMAIPFYENRQRLPRIRSAVAEEEAAAVGMEGEVAVKEEEEAGGGGSEEVAPPSPEEPLTKLYFGNLPYNCDSAQLAGIVQEHATPEIVEGQDWRYLHSKVVIEYTPSVFPAQNSVVEISAWEYKFSLGNTRENYHLDSSKTQASLPTAFSLPVSILGFTPSRHHHWRPNQPPSTPSSEPSLDSPPRKN